MPLEKTYEELLASKINPRNYSAVLPVIYNLRKKSFEPYVPTATKRIVFSSSVVGDGVGAASSFTSSTSSCKRGEKINLIGSASYALTDGTISYVRPAVDIVAQIDMGIKNENRNLIPYDKRALVSQIGYDGGFNFDITSEITEKLSIGLHYVYIEASSPNNKPVRLYASGTPADPADPLYYTRTFTITE